MTVLEYFVYAGLGKLTIYFIQIFPLDHLPLVGGWFRDGKLNELWKCDLCLGFWTYFVLAFLVKANFLGFYIPIITEMMMGMITSFLMHLISIGWKDKFSSFVLE